MLPEQKTKLINAFIYYALAIRENFNNRKDWLVNDPDTLIVAIRAFNHYMTEEHNGACQIYDRQYPNHQEKLRDRLSDDELGDLKESSCRYCLIADTPVPISADIAVKLIQAYAFHITAHALLNPIELFYSWWYKTFFIDIVTKDSELSDNLTLPHK